MTRVPRETIIRFVQGKCSPEEGLRILEQIELSPESSQDLDLYADILGVFHESPDLSPEAPEATGEERPALRGSRLAPRLRRPALRYSLFAGAVVLLAIIVMLRVLPQFERNRTTILDPDLSMVEWATRGATGGDVDAAREAAYRGDFSLARKHILRYHNRASTDDEKACALITAGVLAFLEAHDNRKGWWHRAPDEALLRVGIGYLEEAIRLPGSWRMKNEARLLLARGLYLADRKTEAAAQLDAVSSGDSSDLRQAEALRSIMGVGSGEGAR